MAFRTRHRKADRGEVELLRGLITLANQLQSSLTLDAIVHVIATALSETFGFREASVYLRGPDDDFSVHATVGEFPEYDRILFERPVPRRIWDQLFLEKHQIGSSYFVDHRRHHWTEEQLHYLPELDLGPRRHDEWNSNDDLFVPLYDKDHELMGVLDLFDPADRQLPTLELVKSLEVFATHAAVAIENARQYEALEEATAGTAGAAGPAPRHPRAQRRAARDARAARGLRPHRDAAQGDRRLRRARGPPRRRGGRRALQRLLLDEGRTARRCAPGAAPIDVGVSGWVVSHNEAQLVNDMLNDPRGALVPGTEWEPQASLIAPLALGDTGARRARARPAGRAHASTSSELEPVTLFANLAAIAIHNARQYQEAEKASRQLADQLALSHELLSASGAVLSSLEQTEVLEHIADTLKQIVDYDAMDVRLVDARARAAGRHLRTRR